MSQHNFADSASPAPAKPKSSASPVIIILVVVLAVMCLPAIVGAVLLGGGVLVFWASESRPAPMEQDSRPMVAPFESESRPTAPMTAQPAEADEATP